MLTGKWKKSLALCLTSALILGGLTNAEGVKRSYAATDNAVQSSVSGGAISGSAVSDSAVSKDTVSGGAISGGAISGSAVSGNSVSASPVPTATASPAPQRPLAPVSVSVRGGSKKVRVTWTKVDDAEGYYIYCRESSSATYTKIKTITKPSTVSFDKTGLTQNTTYYFCVSSYKTVNGSVVESALSTAVYAKTVKATKTSKAAKKYNTKAKFLKSPVYKKYKKMVKALNYSKSYAIPGMVNTNVAGFNCTSMVPQGVTLAGSYFLISAYDSKGLDNSVIYIVSRSSKSYIATIILPNKAKVGGIAYDGTNVWVSKGSNVASFPYSFVTDVVNAGVSYKKLTAYSTIRTVKTTASFMGYYNGILWVGAYNSTSSSKMYGYKVGSVQSEPTLTQTYKMSVPSKTQGITFNSDGTLILTRACGKNPGESGYVSHIRTYLPSYSSPSASGNILKNAVRKKTVMPAKVEGVAIYGTYSYVLFSSSHFSSCKYPVDRVLALKINKLI